MPKDHAKIYASEEQVQRWKKQVKQTKYRTLSALGRIAIELLLKYPDLPEITMSPPESPQAEEIVSIIESLTERVRALEVKKEQEEAEEDDFFETTQ